MLRRLLAGAAAGAAGTTALNAATYLDMAWRARPASTVPEQAVERLADLAGKPVPGTGEEHEHRLTGVAALSGIAVGVGLGAAYGLVAPRAVRRHWFVSGVLLGAAAMAASDVPLSRLGVTDPRTWTQADWASDVVPHLAYGLVTAWTAAQIERRPSLAG